METQETFPRRTFRDLLADLQALTPEQLDQPVKALVDDEGSARSIVEVFPSEEDIYDIDESGDGGYTLEQVKDEFPEEWEEMIKTAPMTPKGTVFVHIDNPYTPAERKINHV